MALSACCKSNEDGVTKYRVVFEYVNPISHPEAFHWEEPIVPASVIPEAWWTRAVREAEDQESVREQADGLRELMGKGELIRNIRVEEALHIEWVEIS